MIYYLLFASQCVATIQNYNCSQINFIFIVLPLCHSAKSVDACFSLVFSSSFSSFFIQRFSQNSFQFIGLFCKLIFMFELIVYLTGRLSQLDTNEYEIFDFLEWLCHWFGSEIAKQLFREREKKIVDFLLANVTFGGGWLRGATLSESTSDSN